MKVRRKSSAAEGCVGNYGNAFPFAKGDEPRFDAAFLEMVEYLIACQALAPQCPLRFLDILEVEIAHADESSLAVRHQLFQRAHCVFDRKRTGPMQQIEIQMGDSETP